MPASRLGLLARRGCRAVAMGAADLRSDAEIVAYHGRLSMREQETTIWMDGRPHPPDYERHSWSGFTTGVWEGPTLVQTATHLKEAYTRRWGPMRSDQATVRTRWKRIGSYLRATVIVYDPVYMAEPYILSPSFLCALPRAPPPPPPPRGAPKNSFRARPPPHALPGKSFLPGQDPELTDAFGTPYEPRLGGPETMYPEDIAKMKSFPRVQRPSPAAGSAVSDIAICDRRGEE